MPIGPLLAELRTGRICSPTGDVEEKCKGGRRGRVRGSNREMCRAFDIGDAVRLGGKAVPDAGAVATITMSMITAKPKRTIGRTSSVKSNKYHCDMPASKMMVKRSDILSNIVRD